MLNALVAALLAVLPLAGPGPNHAVDDPFTSDRAQWFRDARFGMFIHFGGYSQLEGEYKRSDGSTCQDAEWIMNKCKVPTADYERLVKSFNPAQFDAKAIVGTAKAAGQKYIVITSKHHDGYAMWPTKVNKWNLRDHSAFDRSATCSPSSRPRPTVRASSSASTTRRGTGTTRTRGRRRTSRGTRPACAPSSSS